MTADTIQVGRELAGKITVVATPAQKPPEPADPPLRELEVDGLRLTYTDEGPRDAPLLVALHGMPGGTWDFRYLGPALAERIRFVRLDLPGFGGSVDTPVLQHTPGERARLVADFIEELGRERAAVLGHSFGGSIALRLATDHPERTLALVLAASIGLRRHRMFMPTWVGILFKILLSLPLIGPAVVPRARRWYKRAGFKRTDEMTRREFITHVDLVLAMDFEGARAAVGKVACPTLVTYADDDHFLETAIDEELVAKIPGARGLRFETGGHNLQKSRARELAAAIFELLGV